MDQEGEGFFFELEVGKAGLFPAAQVFPERVEGLAGARCGDIPPTAGHHEAVVLSSVRVAKFFGGRGLNQESVFR